MIERYIEATCDVCGEVEWSLSQQTLAEFRADYQGWKHRGQLDMCARCVDQKRKWSDATLHTRQER